MRTQPAPLRGNYDPARVGHTRQDSPGILELAKNATEREIKTQYRRMARIFHPDKYDSTTTSLTKSEAEEHFKQLNNVYEYLRNTL